MADVPKTEAQETSRPASVTDRRVPPTGVLPRHLQTWLMVGIAVVILLIILITGHPEAPTPPRATTGTAPVTVAPADRIRSYQQQLADEEARQRQTLARGTPPAPDAGRSTGRAGASSAVVRDDRPPAAQSLLADNVALSHRQIGPSSYAERSSLRQAPSAIEASSPGGTEALEQTLTRLLAQLPTARGTRLDTAPTAPPVPPAVTEAVAPAARRPDGERRPAMEHPAPGPRFTLLEGSVIETALLTRLDGTFAGPVTCLVTSPVYSQDRQRVLIPEGARVLGAAAAVQGWGDSRLAVSFHRLLMPDGHTYNLDLFKGLDQVGESGVHDAVNRHYLQVFGASIAIGALSGLAQLNTRGGFGVTDFGDEFRQTAGSSVANSATRILDRYLNVLPTLTIREGHRIKVYLTNDIELPAYVAGAPGGVR